MGRLVTAFVILIVALLGLTVIRSPDFRQRFLNQFGSSTQTQTTGFSTSVPTDGSNPIASNPQGTQRPNNQRPNNSGSSVGAGGATGTNRPNRRRRPITAAW